MELKPHWALKRDPEHQPVRFLAGIWQHRMAINFGFVGTQLTPKELGQLKLLMRALGPFAMDVIDWVLDPVNWWRFSHQVRVEGNLYSAPHYPHVGFLLAHHGRALRIMRWELLDSTADAHVNFCTNLDQLRFQQMKTLASVYADGLPDRLAMIEAAKTLTDIQRVFITLVDESKAV
jgi:hypothetical protein